MKEFVKKPTMGSLFSGIGGIELGFERAGWRTVWQVENNPFCLEVLEKHWPEVAKYEDVRDFPPVGVVRPDIITGGFPCQDVSVAGKRKGLKGERSGLWFEMLRVVRELGPRWVLVENVPGLLSVDDGMGFGTILRDLAEGGYDAEWRVLDSRYFGVPQRRRRVFVVANSEGVAPGKVLFESDGELLAEMEGRLVSRTLTAAGQTDNSGGCGNQLVIGMLKAAGVHTMSGVGYAVGIAGEGSDADGMRAPAGISGGVDGNRDLKRLDNKRWKALGNAVTVHVAEWIGRRILKADNELRQCDD